MRLFASLFALAAVAGTAAMAEPAPYQSIDIEAAGPQGALKGTLAGPIAPDRPVVLIIPGSGPTDRDGNRQFGLKAASYKLLAEALASRQIASVRIDKRGMFASAAATENPNAVTVEDYASDTLAWIAAIRQKTGASCVWLAGHSEGGAVALAAAAKQPDDICGLVLVSTTGRPLPEMLKEGIRASPANAPLLEEADKVIDRLAAGERVDASEMSEKVGLFFDARVQDHFINTFRFDPAKLIHGVSKPMLILQGERDIQVSVADAEALKQAKPDATLKLLPKVNHVLKEVETDDRAANMATYTDPNLPLAPGVAEAIAEFVSMKQGQAVALNSEARSQ